MKDISQFSTEEIRQASQFSPALRHYLNLIQRQPKDISEQLRQMRHKDWTVAALNTFFAAAPTSAICYFWSQSADRLLQQAWETVGLKDSPLCLFALGKLGSQELNLSSDVDLVLLAKDPDLKKWEGPLKDFRKLLSENTIYGFVFRLDFDLRPGGRHSPLITSLSRFESHYWSHGEPWERLALTRLRRICGDSELALETEDLAKRFCYRKFIDVTLLDELKTLRGKIHKNLFITSSEPERNIKLCLGGIRDIELFLQSLSIIHGGRIKQLQQRSTAQIARELSQYKIIPENEADFLSEAYWKLRDWENKVQILQDNQDHNFPRIFHPPLFDDSQEKQFRELKLKVDHLVSSLLGQVNLEEVHLPSGLEAQEKWLGTLGFSEKSQKEIWPKLIDATSISLMSQRDEKARQEFLYRFVQYLAAGKQDKDHALIHLSDFVRATRAKASFYSLLLREEQLLKELTSLFSTSPYLSQLLCSRPELIDNLLLRSQEPFSEDFDVLLQEMAERRLLTEVICALEFLHSGNLDPVFINLTMTADEICTHLLNRLKRDLFPQSTLSLIALGKWGGQDLGFRSDLDFAFTTREAPTERDFKIAKRFVSRLQDQHRGGRIYGVDLRLRPSGTSGPLIVSEENLKSFLSETAEAWQLQSYLRARSLSNASYPFFNRLRPLSTEDLSQLKAIRTKLLHPKSSDPNIKYFPGGLVDSELCTQTLCLFHGIDPSSTRTDLQLDALSNCLPKSSALLELKKAYLEIRRVEQLIKLLHQSESLAIPQNPYLRDRLATFLNCEPKHIETRLLQLLGDNEQRIKGLDPIWLEG